METPTLDIDQFNPKKAELTELAAKCKDLTINGVEDKEGYLVVKAACKELQTSRVTITKQGKFLRDEATAFNRSVLTLERELLAIVEPEETRLKGLKDGIDKAIERENRKALLPERKERLAGVGTVIGDDELLDMSPEKFEAYFNDEKMRYLERKDAISREKEEKEKAEEQAKEREAELEKAKEDAAEKAKKETEERLAREAEDKKRKEAEEKARMEKRGKYSDLMKKHGADSAPEGEFHVITEGNKVTLYKRIDSITL